MIITVNSQYPVCHGIVKDKPSNPEMGVRYMILKTKTFKGLMYGGQKMRIIV